MKRSLLMVAVLAVLSISSAAFAGEKSAKKFPMSAQEFKQKHDAHVAKAKTKLEERIKAKNVDPEKAKLMRARFEAVSTKVGQAVSKAAADGQVTKGEAKEVRKVAKEARHEGRKHAKKRGEHGKRGEPSKGGDKAKPEPKVEAAPETK
jgi:hypothetical protein